MIGDYPTQLDEIDQWLHDNFGILPGACSSTENLRYSVARRVAEALWPKTQSLPSNVDEAAEEYQEQVKAHFLRTLDHPSAKDAFKAGAEWQKEQIISALKNDGELPIEFIDKFHEIDRNAFQNGQKNVKEQMLKKSMPTWKMSRNNYEDPCIGSAFEKTGRRYTALYMGGYFIDLDDLFNKLPKEQDI